MTHPIPLYHSPQSEFNKKVDPPRAYRTDRPLAGADEKLIIWLSFVPPTAILDGVNRSV